MGRATILLLVSVLLLPVTGAHASTQTYSATYVVSVQHGDPLPVSPGDDDIAVTNSFVLDTFGYKTLSFSVTDQRGPVGLRYKFSTSAATVLVCNGASGVNVPATADHNQTVTVTFQSPTEMPPALCPMPAGATTGRFIATLSSP